MKMIRHVSMTKKNAMCLNTLNDGQDTNRKEKQVFLEQNISVTHPRGLLTSDIFVSFQALLFHRANIKENLFSLFCLF